MEFPPPPEPSYSWLVRQSCDQSIPEMDPVKAAEWSKALNAWHEAHWKPIIERANAADKVWRLANKDMFDAKKAAFDAKKAAWEKFKNTNDTLFKDMDVAKDIMDMIDEFTAKGSKDDNGDA